MGARERDAAGLRNVVVVNDHCCINGGQARVAVDSASQLAAAGFRVTFFAPCGPPDPLLAEAGVRVVCLDQKDLLSEPDRLRAARQGLWNPTAARELKRLLAELDPSDSIVHCHGFAKALSPAIGPVITQGRLAHVYTMHEYFLACPNGGFYDYPRRSRCERKALGLSCLTANCDARSGAQKGWRVVRQALLLGPGRMPRGLKDVIYLSETQKRLMTPYLNPDVRLHSVPNPMPHERKPRVRVEDNSSFVFVGRLSPEKGALLFAQAARAAGVEAVFVGDGPEREKILEANPEAVVTGWVPQEEVDAWLKRARLLVLPSVWYETFALTVYEAAARGVPTICGDWTACADFVRAVGGDGARLLLLGEASAAALGRAIDAAGAEAAALSTAVYDAYWSTSRRQSDHCEDLVRVYETARRLQATAA